MNVTEFRAHVNTIRDGTLTLIIRSAYTPSELIAITMAISDSWRKIRSAGLADWAHRVVDREICQAIEAEKERLMNESPGEDDNGTPSD